MSMKKLILLIVLLVSLVAAAGCGKNRIQPHDSNATKVKKATDEAAGWLINWL